MKIWLVTTKDGNITTTLYVQAATKGEAQTIAKGSSGVAEAYVQGTVNKVPAGYNLITSATPTGGTTTDETPTTTTGGTTTGGTTGGTTTGATVGGETPATGGAAGGVMWQYIQNKIAKGIPLSSIEQAWMKSNISSAGAPTTGTPTGWTAEQTGEFEAYMVDVNSGRYPNLPSFGNIEEFWEFRNNLSADQDYYFSTIAGSLEQWDIWEHYQAFGSTYGDLDDYNATNWAEFINNYDQALQQYEAWRTEAGSEAAGFTDDQIREKAAYMQYYYQYGKPGDLVPVDVGDFINRHDEFLQQQAIWQQQAAEVEKYEVDPGEAARRREEAYGEGRVAAGERYRETPEYFDPFTKWMNQQKAMSGAFTGFVEDKYQSLRSEYKGGLPPLTGFPTPAAARSEAEKREAGLQAWLPGQVPGLYQEYMGQRPAQRGERLGEYSPTMRTTNW